MRRTRNLNLEGEYAEFRVLGSKSLSFPSIDYALMRGREVIVDCRIKGFHGQAFTDSPLQAKIKVGDLSNLDVNKASDRALLFSCLNCVMAMAGEVRGTVHCYKDAPERCGVLLADEVERRFGGRVKVAHIGFQPGHVKATAARFGKENVKVTDLNPDNVGKERCGVVILGGEENREVIRWANVACITGSSVVNGTLFELLNMCEEEGVHAIVYGVTVKGAAQIIGLPVFCPLSLDGLLEEA